MQGWVYYKLLHEPGKFGATTDAILVHCVRPVIDQVRSDCLVDQYHFLRYNDDDGFHLRLRLRCVQSNPTKMHIDSSLRSLLAKHNLEAEVTLATYIPEVTKYGGEQGLAIAEDQFDASSIFALECLASTVDKLAPRLIIAAFTMQATLAALANTSATKCRALQSYIAFWHQFLETQTGGQYQLTSPNTDLSYIWRCVRKGQIDIVSELGLRPVYQDWLKRTLASAASLISLSSGGQLKETPINIGLNYSHTFHNRLGLSLDAEIVVANLLLDDYQ